MPGCPVAWVGWCGYIDDETGAIISHLQDDREDEAGDWPKPSDMYKEIKNGQHDERGLIQVKYKGKRKARRIVPA